MELIKVDKVGQRYIARASFAQKDIPKAAGFRWDPNQRYWWTSDAEKAAAVSDPEAAAHLMAQAEEKKQQKAVAVDASRASDADVDLPCPEGIAYLPYQRAGIAAAIRRLNVLFADEMGLGKTIQAIGLINADDTIKRVLVICPASLRLNWQREMAKWLVRPMRAWIVQGSTAPPVMPVTIINYDVLAKHIDWLQKVEWDLVIVDEAHYLKSKGAKRSQAVFGIDDYAARKLEVMPTPGISARRKVALTGTPIPNRVVEGYGLFHWLAPDEFNSFFGYAKQFCNATKNGYGWDMSGSSNLPKLQEKLRSTIMIRRLKADVLTELPAKRRAIVEFPSNGATDAVEEESEAWERSEEEINALRVRLELAKAGSKEEYETTVLLLREATQAAFAEISKLRHATALATVPYAVDHILTALGDEGHKIVVMAHHKDVIALIMSALAEAKIGAVSLTGDTPMQTRQANVDCFQANPDCRVFVGNIQAAGVGITLTAAAHVVFAELDWVPGNMTQAEDRCHRIGQTDSVLVQHLVLEGSLSARMAKVLIDKQEVIDRALDRVVAAADEAPATPANERAATESLTRSKLDELAQKLTPANIAAIHAGLKILAGFDTDHAQEQNGIGYSKMDVQIGHSLARSYSLTARQAALGSKLITKYRRQLPGEIVQESKPAE